MSRASLVAAVVLLSAVSPLAAQTAAKDAPEVAATRKKLQAKITVSYEDELLKDVLKDLKDKVNDAEGGGAVSFSLDAGVSMNLKIAYKGKDQTVAEILDGMFKKNGLGYVISRQNDRYKGWVVIKQGKQRGDDEVAEESAKAEKKSEKKADKKTADKKTAEKAEKKPVVKDKPEEPGDADKDEKLAATRLKLAKILLDDGKTARAKERLGEIAKEYPKTRAAAEAKELLKKLEK